MFFVFLGFGTVLSRVGYLFVSVNVGGIFNFPLQTYNIIRCYDGTFIIPPNGPRAGPTNPARILRGGGGNTVSESYYYYSFIGAV